MAYIKEVRGHTPRVGEGTFVAETAVLIGDVTVGRDSSIWFNTVLRGDVNSITVGDRTNIQDGTVIHTLYDGAPHPSQTHIGNDVSIGHNATIHGAINRLTTIPLYFDGRDIRYRTAICSPRTTKRTYGSRGRCAG